MRWSCWDSLLVGSVLTSVVVGCAIDRALRDGLAEGGRAAAREVMDRFPEITPELKLAIVAAVEAGVDRAMDRLAKKPNGWFSSIISSIGLVLIYIFGHRYAWVRAAIDILKGKPEQVHSSVPVDNQRYYGSNEALHSEPGGEEKEIK